MGTELLLRNSTFIKRCADLKQLGFVGRIWQTHNCTLKRSFKNEELHSIISTLFNLYFVNQTEPDLIVKQTFIQISNILQAQKIMLSIPATTLKLCKALQSSFFLNKIKPLLVSGNSKARCQL